jgi:hypothetical protein
MRKRFLDGQIGIAVVLLSLSAFFYFLHYLIFRDLHHIFFYLISDIAFVFVDVLLVMLVLQRLLELRDKRAILKKLNMVIGTFFCEVGTELIRKFTQFDTDSSGIARKLIVTKEWTDKKFLGIRSSLLRYDYAINSTKGDLKELRDFLIGKRQFLLGLLENPNLLEHESFTDLLWAVFHLTDELAHRVDVKKLPDTDYEHLAGDIRRAYLLLVVQWLDYMKHLKESYPYLFSLAMRTNPFDSNISVEIR